MSNQWQDRTRGGHPVENVRRNDIGIWKWTGEVTHPDGSNGTLTWTEDGYHMSHRHPRDYDLVPLESPPEAPAEAPAEPDARKALAEAARAYKRACDVMEAAEESQSLAHDKLEAAFGPYGESSVVVVVDGRACLFSLLDLGVCFEKIEVL